MQRNVDPGSRRSCCVESGAGEEKRPNLISSRSIEAVDPSPPGPSRGEDKGRRLRYSRSGGGDLVGVLFDLDQRVIA
jgi:hypothetical protein